jgi:peptidoglycan/LPS O-acetylase OafA/YrhL
MTRHIGASNELVLMGAGAKEVGESSEQMSVKLNTDRTEISGFVHLDMARGLAALAVLLGHLRSFVFLSYGELGSRGPIDTMVWLVTGFGHQAVTIFFVLSGFFITRSILTDDRGGEFSWPMYLIKRVTRLWIVLIPCLFLTLLCDKIGMTVAGNLFYEGEYFSIYNSGPSATTGGTNLEISTLFENVVFLQTIISPIFGTNGPLWSLANEFWYYIMFPLLYIAITRRQRWLVVVANLTMFLLVCIFVGKYITISFLMWMVGAFSYIIYARGWLRNFLRTYATLWVTLLVFFASLAVSKGNYGSEATKDFLIGFAASALVLVLAGCEVRSKLYIRVARLLADGSYTMYLVHFPFMAMVVNIVLMNKKFDASFSGYVVYVGFFLITAAYCYAIYWLFERHTATVRRYCLGKYRLAIGGALKA